MTIWLSMKYLKLTYVTSIQCILKHECNWFDNLKCTVYISFNCQIDGITDKSNIANKWKSKPRLCAVLLPIRLVTDWENMSGSSISWILVDCPYMYILSKLQSNHSKLLFSHFFLYSLLKYSMHPLLHFNVLFLLIIKVFSFSSVEVWQIFDSAILFCSRNK